jgi:hypothetical protein
MTAKPEDKVYYATRSMCPTCRRLLPAEVVARDHQVFVARTCPEHGPFEGLVCSDQDWYEWLPLFDVEPVRPEHPDRQVQAGCPDDCGMCAAHRQSIGTAAIEISNRCDAACPTCLAANQATFELTVDEVRRAMEHVLAAQPSVSAFTLSGGEPTTHPQLFEIIALLERPEIGRIVINSNGKRIAEDDAFLDRLATHPNVYVCLHYDGQQAHRLRGIDHAVQERALTRLVARGIKVTPLVLATAGVNDQELGGLARDLLTRSPGIPSVMMSMMAFAGERGAQFPGDPRTRLTVAGALDCIERTSGGALHKRDFMPLPMPNPICVAVGYFLTLDGEITPVIPLLPIERLIAFTKNANFAVPDERFESLILEIIDRVYAHPELYDQPQALEGKLRRLLGLLFPEDHPLGDVERTRIAEQNLKLVYLMQFMDPWTFDTKRLAKCSCIHLLPDDQLTPSCGYYTYHRHQDPRFDLRMP